MIPAYLINTRNRNSADHANAAGDGCDRLIRGLCSGSSDSSLRAGPKRGKQGFDVGFRNKCRDVGRESIRGYRFWKHVYSALDGIMLVIWFSCISPPVSAIFPGQLQYISPYRIETLTHSRPLPNALFFAMSIAIDVEFV